MFFGALSKRAFMQDSRILFVLQASCKTHPGRVLDAFTRKAKADDAVAHTQQVYRY